MCGDLEAYWKSGEDNMPLPPTCLLNKHTCKENKAFSIPSCKQKPRFTGIKHQRWSDFVHWTNIQDGCLGKTLWCPVKVLLQYLEESLIPFLVKKQWFSPKWASFIFKLSCLLPSAPLSAVLPSHQEMLCKVLSCQSRNTTLILWHLWFFFSFWGIAWLLCWAGRRARSNRKKHIP